MDNENFPDAALVLLGHGTELNENSAAPVFQHAAELRRRNIFCDVREAFWKQEPQIEKVLASISAPEIFIAPMFISEGYFSGQVIPAALGFGASRVRHCASRILISCNPVGSHPGMTQIILSRASAIVNQFPFPRAPRPMDITLFIAGHGTDKNENSRKPIDWQVEWIRARNVYADVRAIFLEESPRIAECYSLARTKNLVIVPFFISDGLHTQEDIPMLLGEIKEKVAERLAAGQTAWRNPTEKNGKLVWYAPAVGSAPEMADVILERVREARAEASKR